jgi:sulfofructose kinase
MSQHTKFPPLAVDVLCAGFACHDLVFDVPAHPGPDEKIRATALLNCGGGLASNGAVTAARLGCRTAFVGYVGADVYGDLHMREFQVDGVVTDWVVRGAEPTPLSAIIVKPDGQRTIVNYRGNSEGACAGHVPIVIDADALRPQTAELVALVDYVVASEHFALEYSGQTSVEAGLAKLAAVSPNVVVTLGERGLLWQRGAERGQLSAFPVNAVDTTGAGDAFHGAFAAGLALGMEWDELLRYASAVGALCCTKVGGRVGIPMAQAVREFLAAQS